MKTQHTKGNWKITPPKKNKCYARISSEHWEGLAKVAVRIDYGTHLEESEEGLANAKLIAAAPELLNACIDIDKLYSEAKNIVSGEVLQMVNKVKIAIKKATE